MRVSALLLGIISGLLGIVVAAIVYGYGFLIENIKSEMTELSVQEVAVEGATSDSSHTAPSTGEGTSVSEPTSAASAESDSPVVLHPLSEKAEKLIPALVTTLGFDELLARTFLEVLNTEDLEQLTTNSSGKLDEKEIIALLELFSANQQLISEALNEKMNATTTSQDGNKEVTEVTEVTPSELTSEESNEQSEAMTTAEITSLLMDTIKEEVNTPQLDPVLEWLNGFLSKYEEKSAEQIKMSGIILAIISFLGFVGAIFAIAKPRAAGIMMLVAAIGGFVVVASGYIVSGPMFMIAGLLALLAKKRVSKKDAPLTA